MRASVLLNQEMRFSISVFIAVTLFLSALFASRVGVGLPQTSQGKTTTQQSAFEKREAAYRANNLGAAFLEQYKAREAVESFTRALEIKPDLTIARINLSIALYYLPDNDRAKREAEKALT